MTITITHNGMTYRNWDLSVPLVAQELEQKVGKAVLDMAIKNEMRKQRIDEIRGLLSSTDYKAIKYAEGQLSDVEYVDIKAQRQAWREEINALEDIVN